MTDKLTKWFNLDKSKLIGKLFIISKPNNFGWALKDNMIVMTNSGHGILPEDKIFMLLELPTITNGYDYLFLMETKIIRVYFEEFLYYSVAIT